MITPQQQIFAIVVSVSLLVIILELVRTRKLREEYSWLWLLVGAGTLCIAIFPGIVDWIGPKIGAVFNTTTVFLFGFLVTMAILIYYATKISRLENRVKELTQKLVLFEFELDHPVPDKGDTEQ